MVYPDFGVMMYCVQFYVVSMGKQWGHAES